MLKTTALAVILAFLGATSIWAEEKSTGKISDCRYFSTRMIMSKSSGAVGHILTATRAKGRDDENCRYDIRLHLGDQLVTIKDVGDYEITWAPGTSEKKIKLDKSGFGEKQGDYN